MIDDERDEASYEKIMEAAEEIRGMARIHPDQASVMLAQAKHLMELAEQIRSDWLRLHQGQGTLPKARSDGDRPKAADAPCGAEDARRAAMDGCWAMNPAG
jgi:hypothetical protein